MLENVEGHLLSMLLHAWARAYVRSSVLVYVGLFLRLCVCGFWPTYVGSYLCMWALICIHETLGRGLTLPNFTSFFTISLLYAILIPLLVIFALEHHCILLFIFILTSKISFFIIFT